MINAIVIPGVSLRELEAKFNDAFQIGLRNLANDAYKFWGDEAGRQLHRTEQAYRDALKLRRVDKTTYTITLHHSDERINFLVTALEVGYPSFDIKKGLLASPSATKWSQFARHPGAKKPSRFLDVPIRDKVNQAGELVRKQNKPNRFLHLTESSKGWQHPGFKPLGTGGLNKPIREAVKERIDSKARETLLGGPLKAWFSK